MDKWREIQDFPGYSVSVEGRVRNDRTNRILAQLANQRGLVYVVLSRKGEHYNRMVSRLVAETFLDNPPVPYQFDAFDTPINRNGDRADNNLDNLMWRPRWFASKYHAQFFKGWLRKSPIIEIETKFKFECILDAAMEYGLLALDILTEVLNHDNLPSQDTGVWPTGQHFRKYISSRA